MFLKTALLQFLPVCQIFDLKAIFDQNIDYRAKYRFLTNVLIFDQNIEF